MEKSDVEMGTAPPPQFDQEQFNALATLSTLISQNGRNPITTICPHCHNSITSATEVRENPTTSALMGTRYTLIAVGLGCFAIVGIIAAVSVAFMAIGTQAIGFALGMSAMIIVTICGMCACILVVIRMKMKGGGAAVSSSYADVVHSCPNCTKQLGISDGMAALQAMDRQNRGMRHQY